MKQAATKNGTITTAAAMSKARRVFGCVMKSEKGPYAATTALVSALFEASNALRAAHKHLKKFD